MELSHLKPTPSASMNETDEVRAKLDQQIPSIKEVSEKLAFEDPDPSVRCSAIRVLVATGPEVIDLIPRFLELSKNDPSPLVRTQALDAVLVMMTVVYRNSSKTSDVIASIPIKIAKGATVEDAVSDLMRQLDDELGKRSESEAEDSDIMPSLDDN